MALIGFEPEVSPTESREAFSPCTTYTNLGLVAYFCCLRSNILQFLSQLSRLSTVSAAVQEKMQAIQVDKPLQIWNRLFQLFWKYFKSEKKPAT